MKTGIDSFWRKPYRILKHKLNRVVVVKGVADAFRAKISLEWMKKCEQINKVALYCIFCRALSG